MCVPFIQITIAQGHDAETKRALVTQVSAAAAAATKTPEGTFRVWIVEVNPAEVSVGGAVLADIRAAGSSASAGHPGDSAANTFVPKGYVVFDLEIRDPGGYEAYRLDGQASIRHFGGRVLSGEPAPRGVVEALEGDWPTKRLVIAEFPTIDVARAWFHSELYQAAARKRQAASTGRVLLVGGWNQPW